MHSSTHIDVAAQIRLLRKLIARRQRPVVEFGDVSVHRLVTLDLAVFVERIRRHDPPVDHGLDPSNPPKAGLEIPVVRDSERDRRIRHLELKLLFAPRHLVFHRRALIETNLMQRMPFHRLKSAGNRKIPAYEQIVLRIQDIRSLGRSEQAVQRWPM